MVEDFNARAKTTNLQGTLAESWGKIVANRGDLLRLGWVPLLVTTAFSLAITYLSVGSLSIEPSAEFEPGVFFGQFASSIVQFVGYAVFAVSAHRLFVLEERPTRPGQFRFARHEGLFFIFLFALTMSVALGGGLVGVLIWLTPAPGAVKFALLAGLALAVLAVFTMFSPVFPRIAVVGRMDIGRGARIGLSLLGPFLLRQIGLALLWIIIVFIVLVVIGIVIVPITGLYGTDVGQAVGSFALLPFSAAATAHGVALLSVLYQRTEALWAD